MPLDNKRVSFTWTGVPENSNLPIYAGDVYQVTIVPLKTNGNSMVPADYSSDGPPPAANVSDANGPVVFATVPVVTYTSGSVTAVFSAANTNHLKGRESLRYDISASGLTLISGNMTLTPDA